MAGDVVNEHSCFVSSAVLADSFVLRNPPLRQAPIRYASALRRDLQYLNEHTYQEIAEILVPLKYGGLK